LGTQEHHLTELTDAARRAGSIVTEYIDSIVETAERQAEDIRKDAERDAELARKEALDSAQRVFDRINALERPLGELVQTLRTEMERVGHELEGSVEADAIGITSESESERRGAGGLRAKAEASRKPVSAEEVQAETGPSPGQQPDTAEASAVEGEAAGPADPSVPPLEDSAPSTGVAGEAPAAHEAEPVAAEPVTGEPDERVVLEPEAGEEAPSAPDAEPEAAEEALSAPEAEPDAADEAPSAPDAADEAPSAPEAEPDAADEAPSGPEAEPDAADEALSAPEAEPEAAEEALSAPEAEPEEEPAPAAKREPTTVTPAPPSAAAKAKRTILSRFKDRSGKGVFITTQGHCAVCQRTFMAGTEENLRLSGWRVSGEVGLCPECQSDGWQLPDGARLPFRRGGG